MTEPFLFHLRSSFKGVVNFFFFLVLIKRFLLLFGSASGSTHRALKFDYFFCLYENCFFFQIVQHGTHSIGSLNTSATQRKHNVTGNGTGPRDLTQTIVSRPDPPAHTVCLWNPRVTPETCRTSLSVSESETSHIPVTYPARDTAWPIAALGRRVVGRGRFIGG